MKPVDVLREMRSVQLPGLEVTMNAWADAFQAAMREPEAWKSIDREGIEDATVYEDTMQDWVRFGRRIVPLFAFPPDAAREITRLAKRVESAADTIIERDGQVKRLTEQLRDMQQSYLGEVKLRLELEAEIERLRLENARLQAAIEDEAVTGRHNEIPSLEAEIEGLRELLSDDYTQLTEDNRLLHRRLGMQAAATDNASEHVEQLRELMREAIDNVRASIAEEGITESRREYRKGLYRRLQAAVTGREN